MAVAATIGVNIVARMDDFTSALGTVGSKLQSAGKSISDMGANLTTNLTLPLAGAAAAIGVAVDKASDLEEAQSAVNQIFGEAGPAIQEFAAGAADSLGMANTEALNAAKQFGIFGKAAGLSGQDLVGFTSDLTTLAADMASFNNTTPEQAILAIGAALRGESEPIRNYGVLLDEATLRQKALELGIVSTTKQALTPQQKVLAAQKAIFEQTAAQQGDFARTSEGLANTQRRLTAEFENVAVELGVAFLPIALQLAGVVSDYVIPGIKALADIIQGIPTPVLAFATVLGGVAAAAGPVIFAVGKVVTLIGMIANPVGLAITAFVAIGTTLTWLYSRFETVRKVIDGMVAGLKSLVGIKPKVEMEVDAKIDAAMPANGFEELAIQTQFATAAMVDTKVSLEDAAKAARQHEENLIAGAEAGVLNTAELLQLFQATSKTREALTEANVPLERRIELTKHLNELQDASVGVIGDVNVKLATMDKEVSAVNQVSAVMTERLQSVGEVSVSVFDRLKYAAEGFGARLASVAKDQLGALGGSAMDLLGRFNPLGMLVTILGKALQEVEPLVKALEKPLEIVGALLGKALAPILEALFPVFQLIAIAATYVGQVFFKLAEGLTKAIGYAVRGIGKAIDALPGVSAKKVIAAGDALINIGEGFGDAYKALGDARDEIRGVTLGAEEPDPTASLLTESNQKQEEIAANTSELVSIMRDQAEQPKTVNVTVQVSGGGGEGGVSVGRQIAQALDDYFGRSVVYEERNLGRVGAF